MISGSIFSIADLNFPSTFLYGKYKKGKKILDVELIEENQEEGTTYVRIIETGVYDYIYTSKIYDLQHSDKYI